MYPIPSCQEAVTLLSPAGSVRTYATLAAFLAKHKLSWVRENVGNQFKELAPCTVSWLTVDHIYIVRPYVLRDAWGEVVSLKEIEEAYSRVRKATYRSRFDSYAQWNGEGPVPGTGTLRRYSRSNCRRIHTGPQMREAQHFAEEGEPPIRARRNATNLPTSWDDIPRNEDKLSWKGYRKTQYKRIRDV